MKEGTRSQLLLCAIYTFKEFVVGLGGRKGKNHSTLAHFDIAFVELFIYLFIYLFR